MPCVVTIWDEDTLNEPSQVRTANIVPGHAILIGKGIASGPYKLPLDSTNVSRKHAELTCTSEHTLLLEDWDSTNGTFIFNTDTKKWEQLAPRKPAVVTIGTTFKVANIVLKIYDGDEADAKAHFDTVHGPLTGGHVPNRQPTQKQDKSD